MLAPVMVFTYSRPEHTRKVLEALASNIMAKETDVFAYTCKPKNQNHAEMVDATKDVLRSFEGRDVFRKYTVVDKKEFKPLGPAMIEAISEVISEYGRIIIVEDDIVTSPYFLNFMNKCLDRYHDEDNVFSISGYSPDLDCIKNLQNDVYLVHRACPWGWATWSDRWAEYKSDVPEYCETMMDRKVRKEICKWNTDLAMTLDALFYEKGCMDKNWEQQFCYYQFRNHKGAVCPKKSLVRNIGFDGTGTHYVPTGLGDTFDPDIKSWELPSLQFDDRLQKKYNRMFIFRFRTRVMLILSRIVFSISPRMYYGLLKKYYE